MVNNSRYTVAIHSMMMIAQFQSQRKITSDFIAKSTGMNPVTIRKVFQKLKRAELIDIKPGPGGAKIVIDPKNISLFDIYAAVEDISFSNFFRFNQNNSEWCPIGRHINDILTDRLESVSTAMYKQLNSITLYDLLEDMHKMELKFKKECR